MLCKQQRRRPACAFSQSDQRLCYLLLGVSDRNLLQAKLHFYLVSVAKEILTFSETQKTGPNHFIRKSKKKCVHECLNPFVLYHGFNGVARTLKKVSTSKGDYWIISSIGWKERIRSQREQILSFMSSSLLYGKSLYQI